VKMMGDGVDCLGGVAGLGVAGFGVEDLAVEGLEEVAARMTTDAAVCDVLGGDAGTGC
jgi:hypothetical protein